MYTQILHPNRVILGMKSPGRTTTSLGYNQADIKVSPLEDDLCCHWAFIHFVFYLVMQAKYIINLPYYPPGKNFRNALEKLT